MSERELIVVDVETTGLDVDKHWVLEVAAINVLTGEELYFVPALPNGALDEADGKAMKINGYFEREVFQHRLDVASSEGYWDRLWDWLDGNTLAGSNPTFDAAMLNRHQGLNSAAALPVSTRPAGRRLSPWHHRLADLSAYAAGALGIRATALPGLDVVCRSLKVENTAPHSALGDARATADCFRKLANMAADRNVGEVSA